MKQLFVFLLVAIFLTGCFKEVKKIDHSERIKNNISRTDFAKWNNNWYPIRRVSEENGEKFIEFNIDPFGQKMFTVKIAEIDSVILRKFDKKEWEKLAVKYIESHN